MGEKHVTQLRKFLTQIYKDKDDISARNGETQIPDTENIFKEDTQEGHMADP